MWYYILNQKVVGPVSLEEIINLINAGVIVKTTCLWQSGQIRQTAEQVPELVPFLQQEPLQRPEPTPKVVPKTVSVPPMTGQRQVPRSQPGQTRQSASTPQTEQPKESFGGRMGFLFQVSFLSIIVLCTLGSFVCTFNHYSEYEKAISEFSRLGAYAQVETYAFDNSDTATMAYSATIGGLVIGCISLGIGYFRKKYKVAIVSCIVPALALGLYFCVNTAEKGKFNAIEQEFYALPYYKQVKGLHQSLNADFIWKIARNGVNYEGHQYPEELQQCAKQTVEKFKELDEFNAQTMQMILYRENEDEIANRYKSSFEIYADIYRQFSDLYKASRIQE